MKYKIDYTFKFLDSYTTNGELDPEWISHLIIVTADNNESTSNLKYNTRMKPRNIAINWLMYWIHTEMQFTEYKGYSATNKHVMKWNDSHGGQLDAVLDKVTDYILWDRNDE